MDVLTSKIWTHIQTQSFIEKPLNWGEALYQPVLLVKSAVNQTYPACENFRIFVRPGRNLWSMGPKKSPSVLFKVWPGWPDSNGSQRRTAGSPLLLRGFPLCPRCRCYFLHLLRTLCHQTLCELFLPHRHSGQILLLGAKPYIINANLFPDKNFTQIYSDNFLLLLWTFSKMSPSSRYLHMATIVCLRVKGDFGCLVWLLHESQMCYMSWSEHNCFIYLDAQMISCYGSSITF